MLRALASAIVASAALLAASGASAQADGYYVATPAAQPAKARLITRSTVWSLKDGAFVAAKAPERDAVLCQLVARDVGALTAFSVAGKPYDAAKLGKCNAGAGVATASN